MKKLDQYVLKELAVPVFIGTVVTGLLFLANEMIAVFKEIDPANVPFVAVVKFVLVRMPGWLLFTIPLGVALGSSLALTRLVREGELSALRSAGYSIKRILATVLLTGVLFSVLGFLNAELLVPTAAKEQSRLASELLIVGKLPKFERNLMIRLGTFVANFGEVEQVGDQALRITDVLLIERQRPGQETVFRAKTGHYNKGIWTFEDPKMWVFENDGLMQVTDAQTLVINQKIVLQDFFQSVQPETASAKDLWGRVVAGRAAGSNVRKLETSFYERFSVPSASVLFSVFAGLLSVRFARGSAFLGLLLSFVAMWMYFNVHVISTTIFGYKGWLSPVVSAWLPLALFACAAVLVMRSLE